MGRSTGDDLVGVGCDALPVKGWGDNAALANVDRVVGGDEALAEQNLHTADSTLFDEGWSLVDENFADVFGIIQEHNGSAHETVVGYRAIGSLEVLEEANWLA
jgi:hypothetical protein